MTRNSFIDTLRGVAVLGILLMNIVTFGFPFVVYENPTVAGGATGADFWWWFWTDVLIDGKMRAIFAMLFGASVVLMAERSAPEKFGDLYARRCLWLLAIGLAHAFLLWEGDILYTLALCGLFLYPFRVLRPRTLVLAGLFAMSVVTFRHVVEAVERQSMRDAYVAAKDAKERTPEHDIAVKAWTDRLNDLHPNREALERMAQPYRGNWVQTFRSRIGGVMYWQSTGFYQGAMWDSLGMMLIGIALYKLRVFTGELPPRRYVALAVAAYAAGLPVALWTAQSVATMQFEPVHEAWVDVLFEPVRLVVALGHIAVAVLAARLRAVRALLAPVGRMALTNYLLASALCTAVFYGYGLGLYMTLSRHQLYYVVAGVWAVQIAFSLLWLRRFEYGPAEWAWRRLIYWRRFPIRREPFVLITASAVSH